MTDFFLLSQGEKALKEDIEKGAKAAMSGKEPVYKWTGVFWIFLK